MTNNWQAKKLGEVTDVYGGGTPSRSVPEYWGNDVPWLTMEDTNNLNVMGTVQYISNQGLQNSNAQLVPAGSVNLSCTASVGNVTISRIPLATNQQFNSFHPHKELIPEFLAYELMYRKNEIKNLGGTTTIPFISKTSISNFQVYIPPVGTQKKIANILSSVDEAIQKTDQIIQKIELLNKGIITQLLDNSSTLTVKLNTVCSKITDGTHRTPKYIADGIPFLRINDIQNDQINWKRCRYISKDEHKELIKRCKPEKGDVLLSKNGTIGITKVVDWEREFSIFVSLCLIKPDRSKVLPEYLAEVVGSDYVMNQVRKRSKQGTVTNLHLEEIRDFDIPLPHIDRQKEVISAINDLKLKKVKEETTYQILIKLKNGMMQDIFSQKVQINLI